MKARIVAAEERKKLLLADRASRNAVVCDIVTMVPSCIMECSVDGPEPRAFFKSIEYAYCF